MQNKLNDEDHKKFIDFLNAVANHAEFKMNTQELCDYFRLLAHMQQVMLPKIKANILEIKSVGVFDEEAEKKIKAKKTKSKK